MKSRKKIVGVSKDRISGLPDPLICHILSFLQTKEAASTNVLAKRWKPLLRFVPNLDFDDSFYFHPRESSNKYSKSYESFMSFVDSVLALQAKAKAKTPLKRFHVKCKDVVDQYWVLEWIPKVLKRGVLDIDLHIPSSRDYCENSSFYPLPSKIFESKTLVRLKIQFQDGVSIHVKRGVSLPKLKTLHLDYFRIDTGTFNKLLSGCHALEELVLVNLMWGDSSEPEACPVTVSIPTLKRLKFCRSEDFYEAEFHEYEDYDEENINEGVSLSFDNPNLVYLEYSDAIVDRFKQVSFESLVEANLRLRKTPDDQTETDKINVTKLLMGIRNVKILYLSNDTLEVLSCCRERIPIFDNLIELTIKTTPYVGWKSLPPLLKSCPSLETLVFEGLHHKYTNRCGDKDGCLCKYDDHWGAKMDVRTCLSSSPVKVLKILKFGETFDDDDGVDRDHDDYDDEDVESCDEVGGVVEEQIEHVKHFLETMPDLEQVILYYNTPKDEDVMKVFKKLQKLPGVASANCNVQIKAKNLSLSSTSTKRGTLL